MWLLSTAWPLLTIIWPYATSLLTTFVKTFANDLAYYVYYGSVQKPLDKIMHYIALFILAMLVIILVYQVLLALDSVRKNKTDAPTPLDAKTQIVYEEE